MAKKYKQKKEKVGIWNFVRDDFITFMVLGLFILLIAFVVYALYQNQLGNQIQDSIVYATGTLAGIELSICGFVKNGKNKYNSNNTSQTDIPMVDMAVNTIDTISDINNNNSYGFEVDEPVDGSGFEII